VFVDRPIFIVSPPRCGTSLLYRCIGDHPDVGYFNRANKKLPNHPGLAHFLTKVRFYKDTKRESRALWNRFVTGRGDELSVEDATDEMRAWYSRLIIRVLELRKATRFVAKLPAFSLRVPWLDALFPDALFVWILRDWRAVVSSTAIKGQNDFGGATFGVKPEGWRDVEGQSLEMRAAWQYREVINILEREADARRGRFISLWYEDLCSDPVTAMRQVAECADLRWSQETEDAIPRDVRPPSMKWKQHLTRNVIDEILGAFGDVLRRYEYPPAASPLPPRTDHHCAGARAPAPGPLPPNPPAHRPGQSGAS
jgi:hypothetical protein